MMYRNHNKLKNKIMYAINLFFIQYMKFRDLLLEHLKNVVKLTS